MCEEKEKEASVQSSQPESLHDPALSGFKTPFDSVALFLEEKTHDPDTLPKHDIWTMLIIG